MGGVGDAQLGIAEFLPCGRVRPAPVREKRLQRPPERVNGTGVQALQFGDRLLRRRDPFPLRPVPIRHTRLLFVLI